MKTLQEIYKNYQGKAGEGDKGTAHSYIDYYSKWFDCLKTKTFNLLEIGIAEGKSLKMWKEYFPNAHIFGVDIVNKIHYSEKNITVFHADATSLNFLNLIETLNFDIIIDDGSHILNDQINACSHLLPRLNSGGFYIIEDIRPDPSHSTKINSQFNNIFEIYDLRHERPQSNDNIIMYYKKI